MMRKRLLFLLLTGIALCGYAGPVHSNPVDLFLSRVEQGQIQFVGIDPNDLGNPSAVPVALAQVQDTNGTLGRITASSPGFWRWFGKGLLIVGSTVGGTLGGASAGAGALGLGAVPGAIIGGGAALTASVGTATIANTTPPTQPPPPGQLPPPGQPPPPPTPPSFSTLNPLQTQDIAIYDQIIIEGPGGGINLANAIITGVLADPGVKSHSLPGGGTLFESGASLFAGSNILDVFGAPLLNGEVHIGVFDIDGSPGTTADRMVGIFFQDLVRGIQATDQVHIFLDNVLPSASLVDGARISSRHILAQTIVPEPSTLSLFGVGAFTLLIVRWLHQRKAASGALIANH